jgi:hypothetical protein
MPSLDAPEVVQAVWQALQSVPVVEAVRLGGSRAQGRATELSDWDLYLDGDPDKLVGEVPGLVDRFGPLAAFWEPLSEEAGYMTVMSGPVKVDLFPNGARRDVQPPWQPRPDTLGRVNAHFWDWVLWLGSKSLRHETTLVADELAKMHWFLLGPLGVERPPRSLQEAVDAYEQVSTEMSGQFRTSIDQRLGRQVHGALRRHRLIG